MATNIFGQDYYTNMANTFVNQPAPPPPEKKKRKRDASDPGDPLLERAMQPEAAELHKALMSMVVVPEEQTPWEKFKYLYDAATLPKVFAMTPTKPSDVTMYHMAAALCGDAHLRAMLLPDPDRFVREVTAAIQTLREMHKSDPRVRAFSTHLAHTPAG